MSLQFRLRKVRGESVPHTRLPLAFRLTILLFRARLGWLFGNRFLMLTHIRRKSGQPRRTVFEVLRYDPTSDTYFVASAPRERANWFRNVRMTPDVVIHVRWKCFRGIAERLPVQTGDRELFDYARRYSVFMRVFARLFGCPTGDTEANIWAFPDHTIFLALRPTKQQRSKDGSFHGASREKITREKIDECAQEVSLLRNILNGGEKRNV